MHTTIGPVLSACSSSETALDIGATIHERVDQRVLAQVSHASIVVYYTALISMYTKCGFPEKAVEVYSEMRQRNVQHVAVTYTCLCAECGAVGPSALAVGRQICNAIPN